MDSLLKSIDQTGCWKKTTDDWTVTSSNTVCAHEGVKIDFNELEARILFTVTQKNSMMPQPL